jgi:hypothetical protein
MQRHVSEHGIAAWKHSQYFFRHMDLRHLHPADKNGVVQPTYSPSIDCSNNEDGSNLGLSLETNLSDFGLKCVRISKFYGSNCFLSDFIHREAVATIDFLSGEALAINF